MRKTELRTAYALLLISSVLALVALTIARIVFPVPSRLEQPRDAAARPRGFTRAYWLYVTAAACFGAGLMSYEFISFHLSSQGVVTEYWIPFFLSIATAGGVVASLVLGRLYDRVGLPVILGAVVVAAMFSPLVFLGGFMAALAGLLLWGVGYAVQDTLLKALVAGMLPEGRRNLAFGLFYTGYGFGWLVGSTATGLLYDRSIAAVIGFSITAQLLSLPLFLVAARRQRAERA